ncbi:MAG: dipeptidase E [Lachnospiraceae bacterium]|nr:dipeptidase E [Lachnospiraceae bacterium]
MIAYLTSNIGGSYKENGTRVPTQLSTENGLLDNLKKHWKDNSKVLIISADAGDIEINDSILNIFKVSFPMSGLPISQILVCDKRNEKLVDEIADFDGILIGISAGTMNSAEVVYAQPELEGESVDKEYERFLSGLGITKLMILPHYQDIKDDILDGKRLFEDITYPDSYGREFYVLEDGSYFIVEGKVTTLFGAAYLIQDGNIKQICEKDKSICVA